jgi:glycosyltransferase involved in cell wall biosynthesis
MMSNQNPRVSLGMPVYNGENFIKEAIDSLLAQTFKDFELIISDNASTDRTEEICREYAAKDRRIRYYRNEQNLGAAQNHNCVFELSRGEYFKWAAHDDLCAPKFLERCVEVLDRDQSVVLCHVMGRIIDEYGKAMEESNELYIKNCNPNLNTNSPRPQERFHDLVRLSHPCHQVYGVIRATTLKMTPLIGGYSSSDRILLARLSLLGRFYGIPEYLFFSRSHLKQSTKVARGPDGRISRHLYNEWFEPASKDRLIFPHWKLFYEYVIAIWQAPLSWQERMDCYQHLRGWLQSHRSLLKKDVVIAIKQILAKLYSRLSKIQKMPGEPRKV